MGRMDTQTNGHVNKGFHFSELEVDCQKETKDCEIAQVKIELDDRNDHGKHTKNCSQSGEDTNTSDWKLIYKLSDTPPLHLVILFALQQVLMSLPSNVIVSVLVARAVCGEEDETIRAQLLSSTIFMSALTTLCQVTFGVRLSVYQGPTAAYIIPILALSSLPEWKCPARNQTDFMDYNSTGIESNVVLYRELNVLPRLQMLQGSLVLAGVVHMLIGLTGLIGVMLRYLGPITVIPTLLLLGIEFYHVITKLCETQWAVSSATAVIGMIFAVYLEGWQMPIPVWTKSKGFHIIRYPLQQVLSILLSIGIGWLICGILTAAGVLTTDPTKKEYKTRTDSGLDIISKTPWFYMPYPGQFGPIEFSAGVFVGFLTAVFTSIIDSVADYYACAKLCHVPPPPVHAVNRGIMVEGLLSAVSGFFGTGHGTTTHGGNIGCIGITKVASRTVYQVFSIVLIVLSVCGKFGAVFVTIPDPVLGGSTVVGFGIFIGLIMTNLQYIDLNSSRNLAVLGVSLLVGLMIPNWMKTNSELIDTGFGDIDRLIRFVLANPTLFGGALAFFLDNTVKGTKKERGLLAWDTAKMMKSDKKVSDMWEEDSTVYEILPISKHINSISVLKYIPIMPTFNPELYRCN